MVPGQDRANCFRSAHGLLPVPDGAAVGLGLLPHQQIPAERLRSEVMSDRIYMPFYAASCKLTSCRDDCLMLPCSDSLLNLLLSPETTSIVFLLVSRV